MKLLGNGFEIQEYNGFSIKLPREAGVRFEPAVSVTYMPLINMNNIEPDTTLTKMKLVKSQSDQEIQEYIVFAND